MFAVYVRSTGTISLWSGHNLSHGQEKEAVKYYDNVLIGGRDEKGPILILKWHRNLLSLGYYITHMSVYAQS